MSNSNLVCYTKISPNRTIQRNHIIDTITIHSMEGDLSIEECGEEFMNPDRQASSNYGIGSDGRIGLYVDEGDRSWCSSSRENDNRAVTIEVSNDTENHCSDKAIDSLIALLVDICKRNKIAKLLWKGDKKLIGQVDKQNMTVHRWFADKDCPGQFLYTMHDYIAREVNKILEQPLTKDEAKKIVQEKTGLTDETIKYLADFYRFGDELIIKLATIIKGGN